MSNSSRLDKLVGMLDTGATPSVRSTAARQLGNIQKQHPSDLFRLLALVYEYLGNKSWDTRVAASQAIEAIAREVDEWEPADEVKSEAEEMEEDLADLLEFSKFEVNSVIRHGKLLLGSSGNEYDNEELDEMDPQKRMAWQKAQMKKRLGMEFLDDTDLLDDKDLSVKVSSTPAPSTPASMSGEADIDMSKLSARERNRLKRKARLDSKKNKKAKKVELAPTKKQNGKTTPTNSSISQQSRSVTEQPGSDAIVVEAKRADNKEALFAISEGSWPFESLVEVLCVDLFDPSWERRHGAAMGLREIFKHHGYGAGRRTGCSKGENQRRNQKFLEDVSVRLMCVFALDRFGDYVSDHVVAPVRETCAQTLGVVSQFAGQGLLTSIKQALLGLVERGSDTARSVWEIRHAGMSGLRYVVAVRRDMAGLLVQGTLDAALDGLRAHDDDVRSVSAETLLPLVDTLVACQPGRIMDVIDAVWMALTDLGDDLTASVAKVMELLAGLFCHPQVRQAVVEAGQREPHKYALGVLVPRLYPFFRHTIVGVRRAVLQTLLRFSEMQAEEDQQQQQTVVDKECLRLVFQNMVLETHEEVAGMSSRLWEALLRQCQGSIANVLSDTVVAGMLTLISTPLGTPLSAALLYNPREAGGYNVDKPMIQQDMGLLTRETIMQCRVQAAAALGLLVAAWDPETRQNVFGQLLVDSMASGWSLKCQLAGTVVEEYVMAERNQMFVCESESDSEVSKALVDLWWDSLISGLDNSKTIYKDLTKSLAVVREDCRLFENENGNEVPVMEDFGVEWAMQLSGRVSEDERRQRLLASIEYYQHLSQQLDVTTKAALAGAVIAIGRLPSKLNNLLRAIMSSIKQEPSVILQRRSATAVARMAALCYGDSQAKTKRKPAAADKMIKNLATFVCSDPWTTPVFSERKQQTESILMLEMVQREQANGQQEQQMATAAALASASNKKQRGKSKELQDVAAEAAAQEEGGKEGAAKLIVRGAEYALTAVAREFGGDLMRMVPKLWEESVEGPLMAAYGDNNNNNNGSVDEADRMYEAKEASAQQTIDALRVLLALAPAVDESLVSQCLERALGWVTSALLSRYSAVRNMAARTLATLCRVVGSPAMHQVVRTVLPALGDSTRTHRRQGVAEAIYYLIQTMEESRLLPYVTFLMVPVLGRMSDTDTQTRLVCTNCFAQLLKLVPLEADIPDPGGFSAELAEQRDHERKFLAQLMDPTKLEPFKIPIKVNATLRKYQQEGVDWLAFLNRYELHGVLCDDMGLGKTLQTICMLGSDHFMGQARGRGLPSLVVCPPTLIAHWEDEILKYTECLRPLCYAGPPQDRRPLVHKIKEGAADVVVMSYDVVRNDIEMLAGLDWNYCVLDEGHCIKNAKTKLTQAVKRLRSRRRLILSGTPVQNNVTELWSLFDFLMPGFLGSERQFNETYGKPILASRDAKQMSGAQEAGELALQALHKQVLPFLLRRMKEDVLQDLPPKIIQDYYCELSWLQKHLYQEFGKSAVPDKLKRALGMGTAAEEGEEEEEEEEEKAQAEETGKKPTHVFQALQYLRKLCNHPALVLTPSHPLYAGVVGDLRKQGMSLHSLEIAPKLQALKDLLNQCGIGTSEEAPAASHRVLVFCQHKEMIERIEQDLFRAHMPLATYMRVDGTVEARRRQEIVRQFNADPSIDCLLLTTHVGGLGLNLTGADTVVFVEHDYNPAMDLQAMDRAHRLGQTKVVNVYRLITRGTLEEKIMGLQAFKLHMANTIVNQQNAGLESMRTEELLDLFDVSDVKHKHSHKLKAREPRDAKGARAALEGLEDLWDASQYEDEYNLDGFIGSLQQS